ncbi:MAG: dockerin type I repeat-containing protein, partial [Lachnospira sp.]|nr:dockerin type I repeat-containing protein [Lachnospira sp.]
EDGANIDYTYRYYDYNNQKFCDEAIDCGMYQIYIDVNLNEDYAAVTGINDYYNWYYYITQCAVNNADISGIDAPVAGEKIDSEVIVDEKFTVIAVDWYDSFGWRAGETADYDTVYKVQVTLKCTDNYKFGDEVTATVNGKEATASADNYLYVYYTFDATEAEWIYGDGNGDGEIDIIDAVLVKQYIAGMNVDINLDAGDVNCDGMVDIKDAVKLMKHMAGMDVELGATD